MNEIKEKTTNSAIDIAKLIMAILVIGIHTEPFHFNLWLDRGFGIITRLCLPFFFVTGSYFFFKKDKSLKAYLLRLVLLYAIWSLIYLPFDLTKLHSMRMWQILKRYLWNGNEHALWYLQGSIIGMLIVYGLKKLFNTRIVCSICFGLLIVGCLFSTYAPLVKNIAGGGTAVSLISVIGTRNGLFYAPVYIAIGLWFAEKGFSDRRTRYWIMLLISLLLLIVESLIFVIHYHTASTILWISVCPASYALFHLIVTANCSLSNNISLWMRNISILLYLTHGLFIIVFGKMEYGILMFLAVLFCSTLTSILLILLSKKLSFIKFLY